MNRRRVATHEFTTQIYAKEPTKSRLITVGARLIFLHLSDDGLSTLFAVEDERSQWGFKDKNKLPIQYIVATEVFDSSTQEAE
jgi:hypothetical protein